MPRSLRPPRADDLGLRRALSDRLLPLVVASMTFLAALALAGAGAASGLAGRWRGGAAALLTVQVPNPTAPAADGASRAFAVSQALAASPAVASARALTAGDISTLLKPWLGTDAAALSVTLPAVFDVRLKDAAADANALDTALSRAAPGTLVERNGPWLERLTVLAASLKACAALAVAVVALVATAVVSVATRAGLAGRRDAIEIVHGLGATDRLIAGKFAGRITILALAGSLIGLAVAIPVVLGLAQLSAPFQTMSAAPRTPASLLSTLPTPLWAALAALPVAASFIGWGTAQATVRLWLARLP